MLLLYLYSGVKGKDGYNRYIKGEKGTYGNTGASGKIGLSGIKGLKGIQSIFLYTVPHTLRTNNESCMYKVRGTATPFTTHTLSTTHIQIAKQNRHRNK